MPYLGRRKPRRGVIFRPEPVCLNCGGRGSHFVPASCGEPAFFICRSSPETCLPISSLGRQLQPITATEAKDGSARDE